RLLSVGELNCSVGSLEVSLRGVELCLVQRHVALSLLSGLGVPIEGRFVEQRFRAVQLTFRHLYLWPSYLHLVFRPLGLHVSPRRLVLRLRQVGAGLVDGSHLFRRDTRKFLRPKILGDRATANNRQTPQPKQPPVQPHGDRPFTCREASGTTSRRPLLPAAFVKVRYVCIPHLASKPRRTSTEREGDAAGLAAPAARGEG